MASHDSKLTTGNETAPHAESVHTAEWIKTLTAVNTLARVEARDALLKAQSKHSWFSRHDASPTFRNTCTYKRHGSDHGRIRTLLASTASNNIDIDGILNAVRVFQETKDRGLLSEQEVVEMTRLVIGRAVSQSVERTLTNEIVAALTRVMETP